MSGVFTDRGLEVSHVIRAGLTATVVAALVNFLVALVGSALLDVTDTFTPLQPVPVVVLTVFSVLAGTAIYALLVRRTSRPIACSQSLPGPSRSSRSPRRCRFPAPTTRVRRRDGRRRRPHRRAPPGPRRHRRPAGDAHHREGTLCMITAVLVDGLRKTRALRLFTHPGIAAVKSGGHTVVEDPAP